MKALLQFSRPICLGLFLFTVVPAFAHASDEVTEINLAADITTCQINTGARSITFNDYFLKMFDSSHWPARWTCGEWSETEGWIYILSDFLIFLSYMSIPIMLLWYARNKKLGKLMWIAGLFILFIFLCGFTHLIDVILFWDPMYRFSGFVKLVTGLVSATTAIVMGFVIPIGLRFKSPTEMQSEINERKTLQEVFDLFVKFSPGVVSMYNNELEYVLVNQNWSDCFHKDPEEVKGKTKSEVFPTLAAQLRPYHEAALKGNAVKEENIKLTINGKDEIVRLRIHPWNNIDGSIGGIMEFIEILTETVQLKEELDNTSEIAEERKETIEELSKLANIGTWDYRIDTEEVYWSDHMYEINKHPKDQPVTGDIAVGYYNKADQAKLRAAGLRALDHGESWDMEMKITTAEKDEIWVRTIGKATYSGNKITGLSGLLQNIDMKKKAELILEESNRYLEQEVSKRTQELSESITNLKSTQKQLIESEKLASLGQLMAGIAHEINTPLGAIKASVGTLKKSFHKSIEKSESLFGELNVENIKLMTELVREGALAAEVFSTRELRKGRKAWIEAMEQWGVEDPRDLADRMVDMNILTVNEKYKDLFINPDGASILYNAYHLVNQSNAADTIELAVHKASKIVYALKSYSRFNQAEILETINVKQNIDTVLILYHNQIKQGVEVIKEYDNTPLMINCFPDELIQVWTNIIHNSLQAMQNYGTLKVRVEQDNNQTVISIEDNGPGIPEEIQPRIFDAFFTTKTTGAGSGLGLDIVRKIIDKHQGEISFTSSSKGTIFRITLPLS